MDSLRSAGAIPATASTLTLPIGGMTCASCVSRVEKALRAAPGVESADVNLATGRAAVRLSPGAEAGALPAAVEAAGFEVPEATTILTVGDMTCASCVSRVERVLLTVPGVRAASVNLATGRATVRHSGGVVPAARLVAAVEDAGYRAQPAETDDRTRATAARDAETAALRRDLILAALLAAPLIVVEMGGHLVPGLHHVVAGLVDPRIGRAIQAVLAGLVLAFPGRRFLLRGLPALVQGHPDMNALVAIGALAAYGYSLVATLRPGLLPAGADQVYFEAAAVIVLLVLVGRFLEARARGRTSDAIRHLVALTPRTARVLRGDRNEEVVPLAEVRRGDVVRVRPGEAVAADGIVVAGESYVDESMISGEAVPVAKAAGAEVVGGTVNTAGSFDFRVTGTGEDTVLGRIVAMVEDAQGAKLPVQAAVDRVTGWFVPAILAASAATFLLWLALGPAPSLPHALVAAIAVVIIACPCAMGLATPTSIMVGTGRAAELGVLFRHGDALQRLEGVRVIALDKTGTVTEGRPSLTELHVADGLAEDEVLALMAAVEARSEHPLGQAIRAAAEARNLAVPQVQGFDAVTGYGVAGLVDGRNVAVGAARYMDRLGFDTGALSAEAIRLAGEGNTPVFVAVDGRVAGLAAVADPIRETSPAALAALRSRGLDVALITGDDARTAKAVATRLGITRVVAGVLPDGKVAALERLRAEVGGPVVFVGDGINDAPALAAADVGIAIGSGTDIAVESADVVLMSGDLRGVANALALSGAVMRNIRQNLFWAFAYNVALVPVAAGALYPVNGTVLSPMLAAGAMALSSVFVVTNALRLRRFAPRLPPEPQASVGRRTLPAE